MNWSEIARGFCIADIKQNVDFEDSEGYDPDPKVFRHGEGFDKKHPYITMEFLPANRNRFQSTTYSYAGRATPLGEYHEFAYCRMENLRIRCYAHEFHRSRAKAGRIVAEQMAIAVRDHILKNWCFFLPNFDAIWDENYGINLSDMSKYDGGKGSKIYVYTVDLMLRTNFRYNDIPPDYGSEVPVENINVLDLNNSGNLGPIDIDDTIE